MAYRKLTCPLINWLIICDIHSLSFHEFHFPGLDDGSSTYLCWTSGERAFTILRLHEELPEETIDVVQWTRRYSNWGTTAYHLDQIVRVHKRIVMKCNGSQIDVLFQDITIAVTSDQLLTKSEDKFLKWLILNAISGPIWVYAPTSFIIS